jgi:hypothetical protein
MADDMRTERLLADVELVRSRGDRRTGKLCIMSLVAQLAKEPHTDHPQAASPVISAFARAINDAMDRPTRQRLIPFAPRIEGTHAGLDGERQRQLHAVLMDELLPRLVTDLQVAANSETEATGADLTARLVRDLRETPDETQLRLVQDVAWDGASLITPLRAAFMAYRHGAPVQQAEAVARILITGAYSVARPTRRAWYWDRAVDVVDRLCEMDQRPAPQVDARWRARANA